MMARIGQMTDKANRAIVKSITRLKQCLYISIFRILTYGFMNLGWIIHEMMPLRRPLLRYFGGEVAFREADVLTVLGGFDDGGYLGQYTVHQEEADGGQDAVVDHADRGTEKAADQQQDAEG